MRLRLFYGVQLVLSTVWLYLVLVVHVDEYEAFYPELRATSANRGYFLGSIAAVAELACGGAALLGKSLGISGRHLAVACGVPAAAILVILAVRLASAGPP